ncbi:Protein tyrosine phosphatase type IVA 1 [Podila verticillata]|nr:Protein tyrosine phosphatase type IVA 1 [Podila verticillata]
MARFSISPIKVGPLNFLILDCPSDKSLPAYIPIFEEHKVTDLVRICEGSPYNIQPLTDIGIKVHDDMKFEDGTAPTKEIVARWLELNDEVFFEHNPNQDRYKKRKKGLGSKKTSSKTNGYRNGTAAPRDSLQPKGASKPGSIHGANGCLLKKKGFFSKLFRKKS